MLIRIVPMVLLGNEMLQTGRYDDGTASIVMRSTVMKQPADIRFPLWTAPVGASRHRNIITATVLSGAAGLIGSAMVIAHLAGG